MLAFDNFIPLETEMNTPPSRHKQYHFNLTTSPLYLVKLKNNAKWATTYCIAFRWTDCYKLMEKVVQCFIRSFLFLFVRKFF